MDPKLNAKLIKWGEPAPDWLRYAETYMHGLDWPSLKSGKFTFVTHVPPNRAIYKRLNAMGIRPIPYVQCVHLPMYTRLFGIDLRKHGDWIAINKRGRRIRTHYWPTGDMKNWYTTCPDVPAYAEALEKWVRTQVELGAAGVFVDCVEPKSYRQCYAPEFRVHEHSHTDGVAAYGTILKRLRNAIKEVNPDGALLANANPLAPNFPKQYIKHIDAFMLESYICTTVSTERWFDWRKDWNALGKGFASGVKAGKQLLALSYLGNTKYGIKDDAYFCYCSARLAGFVWSGCGSLKGNPASVLYSTRLGRPRTDQLVSHGVHYRLFEDGLVAVNPSGRDHRLMIRPKLPSGTLYDLHEATSLEACGKNATLTIPAHSGRLYLYVPHVPQKNPMSLDTMHPESQATLGSKHMLRIETEPPIGEEVCFRIDGIAYFTRSGCSGIGSVRGALFGKLEVFFRSPGMHTVEFVGAAAASDETGASHVHLEKDDLVNRVVEVPSERKTKPDRYRFAKWQGACSGSRRKTRVTVKGQTVLTAMFSRKK